MKWLPKLQFFIVTAFVIGSAVDAGEFHFNQTAQTMGSNAAITVMLANQSDAPGNSIGSLSNPALVVGSLSNLSLSQGAGLDSTGFNTTDFELYSLDSNVAASLVIAVDGTRNDIDLKIGASFDITRFIEPDVSINVLGSDNKFSETIANGTGNLIYSAYVAGDSNEIKTTSSTSVTDLTLVYDISGDRNSVTTTTGNKNGSRDIQLKITGSDSDWILMGKSTNGSNIDITQSGNDGSNVIGFVYQASVLNNLDLFLDKDTSGRFYFDSYGLANNTDAQLSLTSFGAGTFIIRQSTENAYAAVTLGVASSGYAKVYQ